MPFEKVRGDAAAEDRGIGLVEADFPRLSPLRSCWTHRFSPPAILNNLCAMAPSVCEGAVERLLDTPAQEKLFITRVTKIMKMDTAKQRRWQFHPRAVWILTIENLLDFFLFVLITMVVIMVLWAFLGLEFLRPVVEIVFVRLIVWGFIPPIIVVGILPAYILAKQGYRDMWYMFSENSLHLRVGKLRRRNYEIPYSDIDKISIWYGPANEPDIDSALTKRPGAVWLIRSNIFKIFGLYEVKITLKESIFSVIGLPGVGKVGAQRFKELREKTGIQGPP